MKYVSSTRPPSPPQTGASKPKVSVEKQLVIGVKKQFTAKGKHPFLEIRYHISPCFLIKKNVIFLKIDR